MWLDRQQKNLYLEQFTQTDKELIKPDMWVKYRETPADNFTLAIPGSKLSLLGATWSKSKEKANPGANAWKGKNTDSSQENTTVEVSTHCNNRTKNDETKSVPNDREKEFQVHFLMRDTDSVCSWRALNDPGGSTCLSSFNGAKHEN